MTIDNKAKHEWEQDNFIKRIKSKAQLTNDKDELKKKKINLKKNKKFDSSQHARDSVVRSK
jgi:hypothetical protein